MKQPLLLCIFCLILFAAPFAMAGEGDPCATNSECPPMTCIALKCAPPSDLGGPCDLGDHDDCLDGLICNGTRVCANDSSSSSTSSSGGSPGSSASSSGGLGGAGPPCSDPNYELPNGFPQAVESRFNLGAGATTVADYIVDVGRHVNEEGLDKYAVRKITGDPMRTVSAADYKSIGEINALGQTNLFFIATQPPAGPLAVGGNTVASIRQYASQAFPGLLSICPIQGGGITP